MASTDNNCSRQRTTMIIGRRTWLFTGTSLVAMGTVVIAAGLALQQQLQRSKCHVSVDCNIQSMNAKTPGIWFGIPIVFYGLLTISAGICRRKAMMMMLAILSVSFILLNLKHLLLSEVSVMSSCSNHNNNYSSQERENETNGGGGEPQPIAAEDDHSSLRFSPEDRIIALEKMLHMRGDHRTKLDGNSNKNNYNDHSMKYQHQPDANGGAKSEGVRYENTEERGHGLLNQKSGERKAVKSEEKLLSSTDVSSNDATASKVTTTLASESIEAEDDDSIYESSGSGKGLDDDEDYDDENNDYGEKVVDEFEAVGEEPERDEYDSYDSEIKDVEGNKTAEEEVEPLSSFSDWYEKRRKRDLGGRGREEEDCVEEDEINLQWFIQLMHRLMAVVRFIVLVLSIVMTTLILAPCCCYQKDEMEASAEKFRGMQSVTPVAATEKDDALKSSTDDATLLQV